MDLFSLVNTYQYTLIPALLVFVGILVLTTYLGIIFWVTRDVTTRTKNLLGIFMAILLPVFFYIPGLLLYLLIRPLSTLDESNTLQFLSTVQDPNLILCVHCRRTIRKEHQHCPYCGYGQTLLCPKCNGRLHPEWQYCVTCGYDTEPKGRNIFAKIIIFLRGIIRKITSPFRNIRFPKFKLHTTEDSAIQLSRVLPDTPNLQVKLNKDGTPRKPRNDSGKKRGKYKPRSSS